MTKKISPFLNIFFMSEFQTGRFDARTYESAKNFLSKNTHGDSVGLAAIIE
jgi:hypothetical protein